MLRGRAPLSYVVTMMMSCNPSDSRGNFTLILPPFCGLGSFVVRASPP